MTAPMAHLLLAEHLDPALNALAAAAFERTHRRHAAHPTRVDDRPFAHSERLTTLADQWDAHPAKFVEAAKRGHDLTGDAVFVDAANAMIR
jgi:hypothetical protein